MNSDNRYNTEQHQQYTTQYAAAGLLRELASKPSPAEANLAGHHAPLLDDATLLDADAEGEPDVPIKPPGKKRGRKPIPGNVERRKAQNRVSQRTYRDKKDQHVKDLETQTALLEENYGNAFELIDALYKENAELRQSIGQPSQALHHSLQTGLLAPLYRTYIEEKGERPAEHQQAPVASSSRLPVSPHSEDLSETDSHSLSHALPSPVQAQATIFSPPSFNQAYPHYSLPPLLPPLSQAAPNSHIFEQPGFPPLLPDYDYNDGRRASWVQPSQALPPLQDRPGSMMQPQADQASSSRGSAGQGGHDET